MFSRTFKTDEYFYCRNCKTYEFGGYNDTICDSDCQPVCVMYKNKSYCSSIHMEKSVIFVGDPAKANSQSTCTQCVYALLLYSVSIHHSYNSVNLTAWCNNYCAGVHAHV